MGASIWPVLKVSPNPDTPIHQPGGKSIDLRPATKTEGNERCHGHGGEMIATVAKIDRRKLPFEHVAVRRRTSCQSVTSRMITGLAAGAEADLRPGERIVAWTNTGIVTVMKGTEPDTIAIATMTTIGRKRKTKAKGKIRTEMIVITPLILVPDPLRPAIRIQMDRIPALHTVNPSHSDDLDPRASSTLTATCP
jgi:hypothetical protein